MYAHIWYGHNKLLNTPAGDCLKINWVASMLCALRSRAAQQTRTTPPINFLTPNFAWFIICAAATRVSMREVSAYWFKVGFRLQTRIILPGLKHAQRHIRRKREILCVLRPVSWGFQLKKEVRKARHFFFKISKTKQSWRTQMYVYLWNNLEDGCKNGWGGPSLTRVWSVWRVGRLVIGLDHSKRIDPSMAESRISIRQARFLMLTLSYPAESVLSKDNTRNRIFLRL